MTVNELLEIQRKNKALNEGEVGLREGWENRRQCQRVVVFIIAYIKSNVPCPKKYGQLFIINKEQKVVKKIILLLITLSLTGCFTLLDYLNNNTQTSNNQVSNLDRFTSYNEVDALEYFGWEYRELQGLVFSINAKGDKDINATEIRRLALTRASTVARNKEFQAFTVLNQDTGIITETETYTEYTTETYYRTEWVSRTQSKEIPYTVIVPRKATRLVNVNYCILLISLITENEYKDVNNVFLVSNYLYSQ